VSYLYFGSCKTIINLIFAMACLYLTRYCLDSYHL